MKSILKRTVCLAFLLHSVLITHSVASSETKSNNQKGTKFLDGNELKSILTCSIPLVSTRVDEVGFTKELRTIYGDYEFLRTDVGEPDGLLTVSSGAKKICEINLSLNREIYFSGLIKVMVISAYSGSNSWFEFYKINDDNCEHLGRTRGDKNYRVTKKLLSPEYGPRVCGKHSTRK